MRRGARQLQLGRARRCTRQPCSSSLRSLWARFDGRIGLRFAIGGVFLPRGSDLPLQVHVLHPRDWRRPCLDREGAVHRGIFSVVRNFTHSPVLPPAPSCSSSSFHYPPSQPSSTEFRGDAKTLVLDQWLSDCLGGWGVADQCRFSLQPLLQARVLHCITQIVYAVACVMLTLAWLVTACGAGVPLLTRRVRSRGDGGVAGGRHPRREARVS